MNEADQRSADVEHWLDSARLRLAVANVASPVRDEMLERARLLVDQTGESPTGLFGPPGEWVEEQIAERRSQGLPCVAPDPSASWRDVPVMGMYVAAGLGAVLLALALIKRGGELDYDLLGLVGFPVVGGLTVMTALTAWEKTLSRRPVGVAVAVGGAVVLGGALGLALLFGWGRDHPTAEASAWHLGLLVLACALGGKVLDRLLPEQEPRTWRTPRADDEWLGVLAGVLRLRADMPESRVHTIVAEAQAHAVEAGSTLQEEFGRPEDYASQFPVDKTNRARRKAWLYTALAALAAITALPPGSSWSAVLLTLLWGALATREWRRLRRSAGRGQR